MQYLTSRQLRTEGHTSRDLARLVRTGEFERVHKGLYRTGEGDGTERHIALLAHTPLGDAELFSHESAALLHGIRLEAVPELVQVIGLGEPKSWRTGHRRIRRQRLPPGAACEVDGKPCTSLTLTMCHLACTLPYRQAMIACDSALGLAANHSRVPHADDGARALALDLLAELGRAKGVARARAVLSRADGRAESPAETLSRIALSRLGLAPSTLQLRVDDAYGQVIGYGDFAWESVRLIGEYDGEGKYFELAPGQDAREVFLKEKRRQQRIEEMGWVVVRWGKEELAHPARLGALVRGGMSAARARGLSQTVMPPRARPAPRRSAAPPSIDRLPPERVSPGRRKQEPPGRGDD